MKVVWLTREGRHEGAKVGSLLLCAAATTQEGKESDLLTALPNAELSI